MPTGLKRYYGDGLHFITSSCYQRRALLSSPESRDLFLKVLELVRNRYRFVIFGYVVMPEHFHLLIDEPERGNPSVVIQALKLGFMKSLPPTSPKTGEKWGTQESGPNHFWQKRFYDFNVWSTPKIGEKLKYMHRNPVVRGLVEKPEDWRWSSFRHFACGEVGIVKISDWSVRNKKVA